MDELDKAFIFMITGLYLMGLPIFAGYLAGFYGLFLIIILGFMGITGR